MDVYKKHFLFLPSKLPLAIYNLGCSMENYFFLSSSRGFIVTSLNVTSPRTQTHAISGCA